VAAVAVIVAALVAVPVIIFMMGSASRATTEAKNKLDAIERIEGYLERDERRELESRSR
jgi:flagellar basal body-associated protein FliL